MYRRIQRHPTVTPGSAVAQLVGSKCMRPFVNAKTGEQDEKKNGAVAQKNRIEAHDRSFVARFGEFVQQSLFLRGEFDARHAVEQRAGLRLPAQFDEYVGAL